MPKDYQPKLYKQYTLPKNVYRQMVWLVRDYDRLKSEQEAIINQSPNTYVRDKSKHGDPTAYKAIKIASMSKETDAIEAALAAVPPEYRSGIFNAIRYDARYPDYAHENTWRHWRKRFLYNVAWILNKI